MEFSLPPFLAPMFIEKGSVALDGISLTVNGLGNDRFFVAIIPETLKRTTLARKRVGSGVNVEADLIGKYIARLYSLGRAGRGGSAGISEEIPPAAGFGPRG
jgi:riboflavin synthase